MAYVDSKVPELPEWEYTVWMFSPGAAPEKVDGIVAAYFQEQGSLLLFKDAGHTVVEAFRTELVTRVMRGEDPLDDADA